MGLVEGDTASSVEGGEGDGSLEVLGGVVAVSGPGWNITISSLTSTAVVLKPLLITHPQTQAVRGEERC